MMGMLPEICGNPQAYAAFGEFFALPEEVIQGGNMDAHRLFGLRLRSLREGRGLTQQQLGELADTSYKYLGAIERGEENPSLKVICKLADALKVEPRDLFEFEHEETSATELKKQLNALLRGADVTTLQQGVKLLRALMQ